MDTTGTGTRSEYPVAQRLRCAAGVRHYRQRGGASAAQIFFRLIVQGLAVGVGVGGVHQTVLNTEMLVQNLRGRRQTVGGAATVADHVVFIRGVEAIVNAHHDG